ncbi:hypothetical protein Tco_1392650, partial [Tanacetum coccineum]
YADFINPTVALAIQSQPRRTNEEERMRNQYSIESLLSVNPQHYQSRGTHVRPDCNEVVYAAANKDTHDVPNVLKQVENTTYIYYFRVVIDDGSAPTTITCVSPKAHSFVPECNEVIQGVQNKYTYDNATSCRNCTREIHTDIDVQKIKMNTSPSPKASRSTTAMSGREEKKKISNQLSPDF